MILVVKPRTLRKAKLITVQAKTPNGEKTRKKVSVLDVEGKTPENYSRVKPTQLGRD